MPIALPGLDVTWLNDVGGLPMNIPTHSRHTPQMHSVHAYDSFSDHGRPQFAQYICTSWPRCDDGVGFENRCCGRCDALGGIRLSTGLESEFAAGRMLGSLFAGPDGAGSSDGSIDGNGSRSLSPPRSYGGGVSALCSGDAVYEWPPNGRGWGMPPAD